LFAECSPRVINRILFTTPHACAADSCAVVFPGPCCPHPNRIVRFWLLCALFFVTFCFRYSRCITWNDKLGSHAKLEPNSTSYYLAPVAVSASRKGSGCKVFVKGVIEGVGGSSAEEKKGLNGFQIEVGGAVEKMIFAAAVDGSGGAAVAGSNLLEADFSSSPSVDTSAQVSSSKSFSFGSLLSKAKKFSISIDTKASSSAAVPATDAELKQGIIYAPVGGWSHWLRQSNRLSCGR
jgi:hypothetical protein